MRKFLGIFLSFFLFGFASFTLAEDGNFSIQSANVERAKTETDAFFFTPENFPSFHISTKTEAKLHICRIDLENPKEWENLEISHLDLKNPAEVKRWTEHASFFMGMADGTPYKKNIERINSITPIWSYSAFSPVYRDEFLTMVVSTAPALHAELEVSPLWTVENRNWRSLGEEFARQKGIVKDVTSANISYIEALAVVYRANLDPKAKEAPQKGKKWYDPILQDALLNGIYSGEFGLDPAQHVLTTGEAADLIVKYLDKKFPSEKEKFLMEKAENDAWAKAGIAKKVKDKSSFSSEKNCAEEVVETVQKGEFDLDNIKEKFSQKAGFFAIWQEDNQDMQFSTRYFSVMNAGVLYKTSDQNLFVWAFDTKTGEPLKNAKVYGKKINNSLFWEQDSRYPRLGLPFFSTYKGTNREDPFELFPNAVSFLSTQEAELLGTTDENGTLQIPAKDRGENPDIILVKAEKFWGVHLERWQESMNPSWFPDENWDGGMQTVGHIYTDRTMFRPGQKINFKGIVLERDGQKMGLKNLPENTTLSVCLKERDSYNDENCVIEKQVSVGKNSSFSGEFDLPETLKLGDFSVLVQLPEEWKAKNPWNWNNEISAEIGVEEYVRPSFFVNVIPEKHDYFVGETAKISVLTQKYAGGTPDAKKISYTVTARPFYETDEENPDFYSSEYCGDYCEYGYFEVASGDAQPDESGNISVEVPIQFSEKVTTNLSVLVTVTVRDDRGEETSETASFVAYKQEGKNSVRPAMKLENRIVETGKSAKVELLSKNFKLENVGEKTLTVKLWKKEKTCKKIEDITRGNRLQCETIEKMVEEKSLQTDKNGKAVYEPVLKEDGEYMLFVEGTPLSRKEKRREKEGNFSTNTIQETLWSVSKTPFIGQNFDENTSHGTEIFFGKKNYKVGETATLLVSSPFPTAKAFITLEGNKVFESKAIDIIGNAGVYQFVVTENMSPNVQVGAFLVQTNTALPRFKIAYKSLDLNLDTQKLFVEAKTTKETYELGDTVEMTISTKDEKGRGIPAEVSLAVVDEALVRMAGQVDTNFLWRIFPRRWILLENSTNLLGFLHDNFFSSFGGAGKGGVSSIMPEIRKDFREVLFWNPNIQTDANGNAKISFPAGQNFTSYVSLIAGFSTNENRRFGFAEKNFSVKKDFVLQPDFPRFVREKDELSLTTKIANFTDTKQEVEVKISASSLVLKNPVEKIVLEKGETKEISFAVSVPKNLAGITEKVQIVALSAGGKQGDAVEILLPVQENGEKTVMQKNGIVGAELEKIRFKGVPPNNLQKIEITFSNSVLFDVQERAKKLLTYPYGCAEQTTSSTLPNAILAALQKQMGQNAEKAEKNLFAGFARLEKFQQEDGGFSLWEEGTESDPFVTATVGSGLGMMENAGYKAPEKMRGKLKEYLKEAVKNDIPRLTKIRFLLVGMQLSAFDDAEALSFLNAWYDDWKNLKGFEKIDVAFAFAELEKNPLSDAEKQKMIDAIEKISDFYTAIGDERVPHYLEGPESFESRKVRAILALNSAYAKLPELVKKTANDASENPYYFSSLTESQKFLMVYEYATKSPSAVGVGKVVAKLGNTENSVEFSAKPENKSIEIPVSGNTLSEMTVQNLGTGNVYYTAKFSFFSPLNLLEKKTENRFVTTNFFTENGKKLKENESLEFGKLYRITVNFATENFQNIAVSVPLPAGLEVVKNYDQKDWDFQNIETRDNRVDIFPYPYSSGQSNQYEFVVRPTTKGIFAMPAATLVDMYNPNNFASSNGRMVEVK